MSRRLTALGTVVLMAGAAAYLACGGDGNNPPIGDVNGGLEAGSDSTAGGDDALTDDGGGGNTNDAATDDTGSTTDDGATSNGGDAGGSDDASPDAMITTTGGPVTDASLGGDAASLNCGTASCHLPSEACCLYPIQNPPPAFFAACSGGGSCAALPPDAGYDAGAATELHCEVQANCGGNTVCCVQAPSSGNVAAHCVAASACVSGDAGARALLCDPSAADAGCGSAGACSGDHIATWNLPNGFGTCGGVSR
jgi:hypothetical protein